MNKNLMIGLGVLAVAGIGLYVYNKRKKSSESKSEPKSKYTGLPTEEQIEKWRRGTRRFEDYYGAVGKSNLISAKEFYAKRGLALPSDLVAPAGMEYYTNGMPTERKICEGLLCLWKGQNFCFCLGIKSTRGVGNCPAGMICVDYNQYGQCSKCEAP